MRGLPAAALAVVPVILLVACSSSSSSTAAPASHSATAAAVKSGTETITGHIAGQAAGASNPTFPLDFRGPVKATASWTPPNNNDVHSVTTFKTTAGNLVVSATVPGNGSNPPPKYIGPPCRYGFTMHATYIINGAKSTGQWAGATGHGAAVVSFSAEFPKLASGKCNISQSAQPVKGTSTATFSGAGPATVRVKT